MNPTNKVSVSKIEIAKDNVGMLQMHIYNLKIEHWKLKISRANLAI